MKIIKNGKLVLSILIICIIFLIGQNCSQPKVSSTNANLNSLVDNSEGGPSKSIDLASSQINDSLNPFLSFKISAEEIFQDKGLNVPRALIYDANPGDKEIQLLSLPLYYFKKLDTSAGEVIIGEHVQVKIPNDDQQHCQLSSISNKQEMTGDELCQMAMQVYYSVTKATIFYKSLGFIDSKDKIDVCIQCSVGKSTGGDLTISMVTFPDDDIKNHKSDILKFLFFAGLHETGHKAQSKNNQMGLVIGAISDWGVKITEGYADLFAGILSGQTDIGNINIDVHSVYKKNSFYGRKFDTDYNIMTPLNSSLYLIVAKYIVSQKSQQSINSLKWISKRIIDVYFKLNLQNLLPITLLNQLVNEFKLNNLDPTLITQFTADILKHGIDLSALSKNDGQISGLLINDRGIIVGPSVIAKSAIDSSATKSIKVTIQSSLMNDPSFKKPYTVYFSESDHNQATKTTSCVNDSMKEYGPLIEKKIASLAQPNQISNNTIIGIIDPQFTYKQYLDSNTLASRVVDKCKKELNINVANEKLSTVQYKKITVCMSKYMLQVSNKVAQLTTPKAISDEYIIGIIDPEFTYKQYKENNYNWYLTKLCWQNFGPYQILDPIQSQDPVHYPDPKKIGEIDFTILSSKYKRYIEVNSTKDVDLIFSTDFSDTPSCPRTFISASAGLSIQDANGNFVADLSLPVFICK